MARYRVDIEAPGFLETHYFEAETPADAEAIGKDIFFTVCNYGVSEAEADQGEDNG